MFNILCSERDHLGENNLHFLAAARGTETLYNIETTHSNNCFWQFMRPSHS